MIMEKGNTEVLQVSVLGPLLWNIIDDGELNLQLPSVSIVVGFADDIAIIWVAGEDEHSDYII